MGTASPSDFQSLHQRLLERTRKALGQYLGDPNVDKTRSLRTALRKFEACAKVLPKAKDAPGMKEERRLGARCAKLLKLTSPVRDIDILMEKLTPHLEEASIARYVKRLREQRGTAVDRSMKASWRLFEQHGGPLDESVVVGIDARIRKALSRLDAKISTEVTKVVADEKEKETLHAMRKHCKRFRYTLEMLPVTERRTEVGALLLRWQNSLGEVRDSDILIEYIEGMRRESAAIERLLVAERELRHRRYGGFVSSYIRQFGEAPLSLWGPPK